MVLCVLCNKFSVTTFKLFAFLNLVVLSGVGIWNSAKLWKNTIAYSHHLNQMQITESESESETEPAEEEDGNKFCLHVEQHKDVLLYATYLLPCLVTFCTLLEILSGILLVRLDQNFTKKADFKKSRASVVALYFWGSYQILLIILLSLIDGIGLVLASEVDWTYGATGQVAFEFGLLVLWKCFIIAYALFHFRLKWECGNKGPRDRQKQMVANKVRARAKRDEEEEDLTIRENEPPCSSTSKSCVA